MSVFLKNTGFSTGDCMLDQLIGANPEKYEFCAKKWNKFVILATYSSNVEIQTTIFSKNVRNLLPVDYVAEFFDCS